MSGFIIAGVRNYNNNSNIFKISELRFFYAVMINHLLKSVENIIVLFILGSPFDLVTGLKWSLKYEEVEISQSMDGSSQCGVYVYL